MAGKLPPLISEWQQRTGQLAQEGYAGEERRISVRIPVSTIGGSMETTALWPVYCFGVK